jgi:hypothetical protein
VRRLAALAALVAVFASCHKKTDAERAAEERAACRKKVEKSLVLVPYRSLKSVVRASGQDPAPPELAKLIAIYGNMKPVAPGAGLLDDAKLVAEFGIGLYRARSLLEKIDEDTFPTLWKVFLKPTEPPLAWYSARVEHLGLAFAAWVFEVTLNKDPVADVMFYELDRAQAEASWPAPLKAASQGARGLAYMNAGYHYAAEEELTGYLNNLQSADAEMKRLLGLPVMPGGPPTMMPLEVAGYLARSWNRFALKRDEPANQDLEAALTRLETLGVEDELVDWGWAVLHTRRKKYPEAAKRLEKLSQSPFLSEDERRQVKEYAASMEKNQGAILFGAERAQFILVRAVIARNGGLEKVLCKVFGDELGKQIYQPLNSFHRLHHAVAGAGGSVTEVGGKVSDVGKQGLDALKHKLGK